MTTTTPPPRTRGHQPRRDTVTSNLIGCYSGLDTLGARRVVWALCQTPCTTDRASSLSCNVTGHAATAARTCMKLGSTRGIGSQVPHWKDFLRVASGESISTRMLNSCPEQL